MPDTKSTTAPADTARDAEMLAIWERLWTDERECLALMCDPPDGPLYVVLGTPERLRSRGLADFVDHPHYSWSVSDHGRAVYEAHQREVAGE